MTLPLPPSRPLKKRQLTEEVELSSSSQASRNAFSPPDDSQIWQHVSQLKSPAEQSKAYWALVYGKDTPQPIISSSQRQAQTQVPLRSLLKRRCPHKRSRCDLDNNNESESFDSPQTNNALVLSFCTPQQQQLQQQQQQQQPYTHNLPQNNHNNNNNNTRVVQFGPSQAVSFQAGTPVEGGLEPLPEAAWQYPTDQEEFMTEDEKVNLEETRANIKYLAAWDQVESNSDDDDEEETSFVLPRRSGRRSSTMFSPHAKSLLEEDDDDCFTLEKHMDMDESEQDNTTENHTATTEGSDENLGLDETLRPWNDNTKEEESFETLLTSQSFQWEQLIVDPSSTEEWMHRFTLSYPLRMLLSAALDATANNSTHNNHWGPSLNPRLEAEVHLMEDLWQHMGTMQRNVLRVEMERLREAWRLADSIKRRTTKPLEAQIAQEEAEIAMIEKEIAREAHALALARKHKLQRQLKEEERKIVEWRALSFLLADIDFPKPDESCLAGLAYGFPVPRLGCEVVLRPTKEGTLDSASLLGQNSSDLPGQLPNDMVEGFRRIVYQKLSNMTEDQEAFDLQQAACMLIIFLGRVDRMLDDLEIACGRYEHDFIPTSSNGDAFLVLQVQVNATTTAQLTWQIFPISPIVMESAFPSCIELVQDGVTTILDALEMHPRCLRSLWNQVVAQMNHV